MTTITSYPKPSESTEAQLCASMDEREYFPADEIEEHRAPSDTDDPHTRQSGTLAAGATPSLLDRLISAISSIPFFAPIFANNDHAQKTLSYSLSLAHSIAEQQRRHQEAHSRHVKEQRAYQKEHAQRDIERDEQKKDLLRSENRRSDYLSGIKHAEEVRALRNKRPYVGQAIPWGMKCGACLCEQPPVRRVEVGIVSEVQIRCLQPSSRDGLHLSAPSTQSTNRLVQTQIRES